MLLDENATDLHAFLFNGRLDVKVGRAFILLRGYAYGRQTRLELRGSSVAHVSLAIHILRNDDAHLRVALGRDHRAMPGKFVQPRARSQPGLDRNRSAGARILVQSHKKVPAPHPLECEYSAILPALLCRSLCELFMNLDERIDRVFQSEAVGILAVIAIKNTRITFRG